MLRLPRLFFAARDSSIDLLYFRFSLIPSLERIEENNFLSGLSYFGLCWSVNLPSIILEVRVEDFWTPLMPWGEASFNKAMPFVTAVDISFFLVNFPEVSKSILIFLIWVKSPSDLKSFEIKLALAVVVWFLKVDLNVEAGFFWADSVRIGSCNTWLYWGS